ncbi:unnamed protein product, partial [Ectocarpus sp. 13 AM-2016]
QYPQPPSARGPPKREGPPRHFQDFDFSAHPNPDGEVYDPSTPVPFNLRCLYLVGFHLHTFIPAWPVTIWTPVSYNLLHEMSGHDRACDKRHQVNRHTPVHFFVLRAQHRHAARLHQCIVPSVLCMSFNTTYGSRAHDICGDVDWRLLRPCAVGVSQVPVTGRGFTGLGRTRRGITWGKEEKKSKREQYSAVNDQAHSRIPKAAEKYHDNITICSQKHKSGT